jgi:Sec-independent protein secretion pathway component TatC
MLLMACPLTMLYFGGVLMCKILPKAKSRFAE